MLQLQAKELDICRITKILIKYDIKANISSESIILDGKLTEELLKELCDSVRISKVQNFKRTTVTSEKKYKEIVIKKPYVKEVLVPKIIEEYDLIYSKVRRGEVYLCDFGEPYGHEQGYIRPAIIVKSDNSDDALGTTIVLPCTTKIKQSNPEQYHFVFSKDNMIDYDKERVGSKNNSVMATQIRVVDKTRLRKYLGKMTPEFMNRIQEIIDNSLDLKRQEYVGKKEFNMVQIQLISFVDINKLFDIAQTTDSNEVKIEKILKLFGFNMEKNGNQLLAKAILISTQNDYFNVETLCESIAKNEPGVSLEEVKRLIVARVKEQFKLKKAPTIDFIRLVNSFLK